MDDVFVAQLMSSELETVRPDALVEEAANHMLERSIGSVLVVDDENRLEGILTTTDFVRIVEERKPKDQTPVETYMSSDVVTAGPEEPIQDAADRMLEHGVHHLPVIDDEGVAIGIVTTTDLAAYISTVQTPSPS